MIHKDSTAHPRRNAKKVRTIVESRILLVDQTKVRLVDERCGRQRMVGALTQKMALRDAVKLIVRELPQLVGSLPISGSDARESLGYSVIPFFHRTRRFVVGDRIAIHPIQCFHVTFSSISGSAPASATISMWAIPPGSTGKTGKKCSMHTPGAGAMLVQAPGGGG
jgi:hypothetical protein